MSIAENVAKIRAEMERAALAAGRDPKGILLCAATKMNDAEAVREAIAAGVDCCGENRVQELTEKQAQDAYRGAPVHFIGHLQTNKVNKVVGKVDLIQSVDSLHLLKAVQKEALKQGILQDILLEINVGQEESKSGFTLDKIHLSHHLIDLVGLQMADKMDRGAPVGILCLLLRELLHPVFTAAVNPCGNGLPDGLGIIHLGGGAEEDPFGIPSGSQSCLLHFCPDFCYIFCNGHG